MKYVHTLIQSIWELPQNILGLLIWVVVRRKIIRYHKKNNRYFFLTPNFGISLGSIIFWSETDSAVIKIKENNLEHEFGHSIQSKIFGPLYLLIIGIPSIMRVMYGSLYYLVKKKKWVNYYEGYPEKWADTLGMKYY